MGGREALAAALCVQVGLARITLWTLDSGPQVSAWACLPKRWV